MSLKSINLILENIINDSVLERNMFSPVEKEVIALGAEAEIRRAEWWGRDAVIKRRSVKGYRHPIIDMNIRKERTRKEVRLMREARKAGVPVPLIYDVREEETSMTMQFFPGDRVMDCLETGIDLDLPLIGRYIGKLHAADITHGDLTTSNIMYHQKSDSYCFIDFSLGEKTTSIEDKGVDLHLMREALISVHEEPIKKYEQILVGYREVFQDAELTISKVKDIESRGRYL